MKNYQPAMSFGADVAAIYDAISQRGDEASAVTFLEQLAKGGPALELAIGTGRIALHLAARGVKVEGIDISPAMVTKLRGKTARIAGLQMQERWSSWDREPFSAASANCVSVYARKAKPK